MDTTLPDPLVDQLLDGRYRIEARIAAGGMATVYRALDTRLDRVLALKVMHPNLAGDEAFTERFIREAKSAARLDHPNVVSVFDQGTDDGYVYLAMEYVAGCTLRDVLRERGALQPRAALDIMEPVLAALGAAHRAELVHRDIKPENVLIGDDGRVKVADFGLVRAVGTNTTTDTGSVLGTLSYLAPEQIEHGVVDTRTDVYACGVVLYEMLTGLKPHSGASPAQVLYQHLNQDVPPPSDEAPGLAPELDDVVTVSTARDPRLRPDDAVGMLGLIREARSALTEEQLDARPPRALAAHAGAEDRTTVLPRPAVSPSQLTPRNPLPQQDDADHTARFDQPPVPPQAAPSAPAGPVWQRRLPGPLRRVRRRTALLVAAAVLAVLAGTGVWYISSGQFTSVPAVLDMTEQKAEQELDRAGLRADTRQDFSDTIERGHVMATDPKPGERIRNTGRVTLTISRGPRRTEVPNVTGMRLAEARQRIEHAGLTVGEIRQQFSGETPQGSVLSTDPRPGTERRPDSPVSLVVSKGEALDVPDITGLSVDDATSALRELGLQVKIADTQVYSPRNKGDIADQSPAKGTKAAKGDTITVTVSKGKEMLTVPDVTGKSEADARRMLTEAGFEVKVDKPFFFPKDSVDAQSVRGGDKAARGDTITIKMKSGF
ncbi:Stk1 family PASTA domain-containing Ser/Thr kinase [Streptomyces sp. NPDC052396]|uniref:Stk1 family PASTA domain-containing Ser/Thr kinase n=1 Tax=Streptomyces sp. NPDC052396 TaxID=3365689 RepID=UPI0037CDE0D1